MPIRRCVPRCCAPSGRSSAPSSRRARPPRTRACAPCPTPTGSGRGCSSCRSSTRSWKVSRICCRSSSGTRAHDRCAPRAASTAAATSSGVDSGRDGDRLAGERRVASCHADAGARTDPGRQPAYAARVDGVGRARVVLRVGGCVQVGARVGRGHEYRAYADTRRAWLPLSNLRGTAGLRKEAYCPSTEPTRQPNQRIPHERQVPPQVHVEEVRQDAEGEARGEEGQARPRRPHQEFLPPRSTSRGWSRSAEPVETRDLVGGEGRNAAAATLSAR